ncbi:MAG: cobyric acid synthase [Desulfobulbaceae bacterium]
MSARSTQRRDAELDAFGHGGDVNALAARIGGSPERIIDFSASINPLGPPECLRRVISRGVELLARYPDPEGEGLLTVLAGGLGLARDRLLAANGSTEIIYALPRALPCRRGVIPVPAYGDYERACRLAGLDTIVLPLREENGFRIDFPELAGLLRAGDLVFLGRPNNPTGRSFPAADLLALVAAFPATFFAVDESFIEFIEAHSDLLTNDMAANLVVFRSLTKFYAIPGLRLGFAAAAPQAAGLLRRQILPWSVNALAQEVGKAVLVDTGYAEESRRRVRRLRSELQEMLADIPGLQVVSGEANYLLVKLNRSGLNACDLADRLLMAPERPVAIRVCDSFAGLDRYYFRVAVREQGENELLAAALLRELAPRRKRPRQVRARTPALMLQGTSSNAGKSVLAAALCRILLQDGFRVAPFKAQNMSLNSFVTRDGGEMGRAQVVQAQACRLDPDVRMNPVLLKPTGECGSQVIVNGRVAGNMTVDDYIRFKGRAAEAARAAYDGLAAEHEVIVLEGAGSPAEVNLKKHDIVNMAMARHAKSPVLLVGDIDRGGVFASFVGSLEVMAEWERRLVTGFLVNRFRGQASLLADAYAYVYDFTGKPVLGTVPYLPDLGLPEEDSVGFKAGLYAREAPADPHVAVGVIDLPHIANFTDVEPFLAEPDVHLRVIRDAAELARALPGLAALILPGSKNVPADLAWLHGSGLAAMIHAAAGRHLEIVGICGGFQMLGERVQDPHRLESESGEATGLGLLAATTVLAPDKTLRRRTAWHQASGMQVRGYEIHHGRTAGDCPGALRMADGDEDGAVSPDGRLWGTYLHGIFDDDSFRRWFIDRLRSAKNMEPLGRVAAPYDLEPALDRLADVVRASVDIPAIYRSMGLA